MTYEEAMEAAATSTATQMLARLDAMPWPERLRCGVETDTLANALCVMAFFLGMERGISEKLGMRLLVHQLIYGGPTL